MKKSVVLLALISLIFTACLQENVPKSIVLKSSGYVLAEPDQAAIDLNLSSVDKNLARVKTRLIQNASAVSDMLVKLGIDEKDILTTSLRLNKEYQWQNGTNVFKGYNASSQVHVVIQNLDILGDFYSRFLVMEDLSIGNLNYQHSKMDSLSNEAYLKALENANELAEKLLTKLPETNKSIVRISTIKFAASTPENNTLLFDEEMSMDKSYKSKMPVSTGNMVVEQSLYVEYAIN